MCEWKIVKENDPVDKSTLNNQLFEIRVPSFLIGLLL